MLPDGVSVRLNAIADFLTVLPTTECEYDPNTFLTLLSAVTARQRLDLRYWSASRDETRWRPVDIYELSLGDDGFYAVGHCHWRAAIRTFAVQRIRSVRETGELFHRPPEFSAKDYFKSSFRVFQGDGDYEVVLRLRPEAAPRFSEKKWHATQVLERQRDGSLIARLRLSSLMEVKRWIMWWGTDCEVLDPPELRDLILAEATEMLASRSGRGASCPC